MNLECSSYSPNIQIYLAIGDQKIRLSDVLFNSATLFEEVEVNAGARGQLVMQIDDHIETQEVCIENGISHGDAKVVFSYTDASLLNGRSISDFQSAM